MSDILRTEGLRKTFGGLPAVDDVDLTLSEGVLTAIIGPNGAGKTTLINLLSGALAPDAGRVIFRGDDITALPSHERVHRGLTRSFQIMNIFPSLSVEENVMLPVFARQGKTLRAFSAAREDREAGAEAYRILEEVGLGAEGNREARTLSHGDQRRLELAIAVAPEPVLCLLDEPSSGMTPPERAVVLALVRKLSSELRTTFVIVEHDMDVVFSLAERIVVMNRGQVLADGPPAAIRTNLAVRETYLGQEWAG